MFGGASALRSLVFGVALAAVTGAVATVAVVIVAGFTLAALPIVVATALAGALFCGVFGLLGVLLALFGLAAWLVLREALVIVAVLLAALLSLLIGAIALAAGAAVLAVAAARARGQVPTS